MPLELRDQAVALANAVTNAPLRTPFDVDALRTQLGPRWDGAETVIDVLTAANLA